MNTPGAPATARTVLVLLLPEQGAFNGSFMLASRLKERNYRVAYMGPRKFERHVTRQGFEYVVLEDRQPIRDEVKGFNWLRTWRQTHIRYREAFHWYQDSLRVIRDWLEQNQPELVLLDPLLWQFAPPVLASNVYLMGINTTLASTFDVNLPPVFSDITPVEQPNWFCRFRNLVAWTRALFRAYVRTLIEDFRLISIFGPFNYRTYRARSLVKRSGGLLRWGEYGPRLVIPEFVMAPREFDFPRVADWTKRIYIGACVYPQRQDECFDWGAIQKTKPLLYCSLGTYSHAYHHSKRLFIAVVDAMVKRKDWQCIIQLGEAMEPAAFGCLPERLLVVSAAPQLEILKYASVFITHGGLSSVRESVYYGVPMIVFPCWLDQPGNAARVVHHRLGIRADISTVNRERIGDLLERVQEDGIRDSVRRMRNIFRLHTCCQNGVDWVEGIFRESPTATS